MPAAVIVEQHDDAAQCHGSGFRRCHRPAHFVVIAPVTHKRRRTCEQHIAAVVTLSLELTSEQPTAQPQLPDQSRTCAGFVPAHGYGNLRKCKRPGCGRDYADHPITATPPVKASA